MFLYICLKYMVNKIFKGVLSELEKIEEENGEDKEILQALENIRKLIT